MNKQLLIAGIILLGAPSILLASEKASGSDAPTAAGNPMNADWFYAKDNPFKAANDLHEAREWAKAEAAYKSLSKQGVGTRYDREMARLNQAACRMAQMSASGGWRALDRLNGVKDPKMLPKELSDIKETSKDNKETRSVLVRSDKVGIGDIVHFWHALDVLKRRSGYNVTVSVRPFLLDTLRDAAKEYNVTLVNEKDAAPATDYQTHLVSLMGHLRLDPAALSPARVVYTAPERALGAVREQVAPLFARGNSIAAVFLGENRQATLIGGRQLHRDPKEHGRHLTAAAFGALLRSNPKLVLLDCGTKDSKIKLGDDHKDEQTRVVDLAAEKQPFDTVIALGRVMSDADSKMVAFGADNGPVNVFSRALDLSAQRRMAFVIPNPKSADMRMQGTGSTYTQMLSNCRVYVCPNPEAQTPVVAQAYSDMTKETN